MDCARFRKTKRWGLAGALMFLMGCAAPPPEPTVPEVLEHQGVITYLDGEVSVLEAGVWLTADVGTRVTEASTVKTGPDSSCDLQFGSLGTIRLSAATTVKLVSVGLGKKAKAADLELVSGTVAAKVTKLVADQRFTVRTRTVAAGVRGTHFLVSREASGRTNVAVAEGVVALIPPSRSADWSEAPAVGAGQEAAVERADATPVVAPLSDARRRELDRSRDLAVKEQLPPHLAPAAPAAPEKPLPHSGLPAPVLVSPRSGAVVRVSQAPVELRWKAVDGATGYVVTLSRQQNGESQVIADWTTPELSVSAGNLDAWVPGPLTWEVKAVRSQFLLEDETSPPAQARILLAK